MTVGALKEGGMMDKDGRWTGKYGVRSAEDFLKDRTAQEKALSDYFDKLGAQLEAKVGEPEEKSPMGRIGQKIEGIKAEFEVTHNGLYAAAHRWGAGMLRDYLNFEEKNGWKSDFSKLPEEKADAFKAIETRLREFQDIEVVKDAEEMSAPNLPR